ncbi:MAG: hypothetical protein DIU70_011750 [Bacillota bacterium]|nr:MAG: hypothetical protein DIU70_08780 [Bacillota bacterium]
MDGPEDQVRREWATRQRDWADRHLPDLVEVKRLKPWVEFPGGRRVHWLDFQRWRRFGSGRTGDRGSVEGRLSGPLSHRR